MNKMCEVIGEYNDGASLEDAFTIPAAWYTSPEMLKLELQAVFGRTWQLIGRTDQLTSPGDYITAEVGGEPILAVRRADGSLKAVFNVCPHHSASVATQPRGTAQLFPCT